MKVDDSLLRYLMRGFLDKAEKSGERQLPCSTEKVERGALDCCWTQQETGSVRLTQTSFLKQPIKAWKHKGSVTRRRTAAVATRDLRQNNNPKGSQNVLTQHEQRH